MAALLVATVAALSGDRIPLREIFSREILEDYRLHRQEQREQPDLSYITESWGDWRSAEQIRAEVDTHLEGRGYEKPTWVQVAPSATAAGEPADPGWTQATVKYGSVECTVAVQATELGSSRIRLGAARTLDLRRWRRALEDVIEPRVYTPP